MNGCHFIINSTPLLLNSVTIPKGGRKKVLLSHLINSRLNLTPPRAKFTFHEHETCLEICPTLKLDQLRHKKLNSKWSKRSMLKILSCCLSRQFNRLQWNEPDSRTLHPLAFQCHSRGVSGDPSLKGSHQTRLQPIQLHLMFQHHCKSHIFLRPRCPPIKLGLKSHPSTPTSLYCAFAQ